MSEEEVELTPQQLIAQSAKATAEALTSRCIDFTLCSFTATHMSWVAGTHGFTALQSYDWFSYQLYRIQGCTTSDIHSVSKDTRQLAVPQPSQDSEDQFRYNLLALTNNSNYKTVEITSHATMLCRQTPLELKHWTAPKHNGSPSPQEPKMTGMEEQTKAKAHPLVHS